MTLPSRLRIGTRGSPLARFQAEAMRDALAAAYPDLAAPDAIEIKVIKTTGDRVRDRALAEIGGKGLFTKEIEQALQSGAVDVAVHSMKDVPTWLPDGLAVAALLPRGDPRDALLAPAADSIAGLARGAVVGTASVRRQAQLLSKRPDLRVTLFRGNVHTRLRKLAAGEVDATLLAWAGLVRLGLAAEAGATPLDPAEMLPAAAQGAIGAECRADDERTRRLLAAISHAPTEAAIAAERALLAALDGSCRTPIAALAEPDGGGGLRLRALVARPDGRAVFATNRRGTVADAAAMGDDAGRELRGAAGPSVFDAAE
ncbi:MAG: hydroxymethylbilane synthase [Alphaproteobacteria bacterium]